MVYFKIINSIPLMYMSILMSVPHHHDYSRIIEQCEYSLFFIKIVLAILVPLHFHILCHILESQCPFLPERQLDI